ncbi:MAG: hypothetical protein MMC33_004260 [Icmadophila ericetorum]|nr:hypothetical protein [Icmadophila ericetorum]
MATQGLDMPGFAWCAVTSCSVQILDGEAKGLLGIQSALGRYELDAEKADRQVVWFEAIRIAPADKSPEALKQWLAVFKPENSSMTYLGFRFSQGVHRDLSKPEDQSLLGHAFPGWQQSGGNVQGEDGVAQINFPNAAKGFRDFILVDEEVQVTVGNRGSVVVIRKK